MTLVGSIVADSLGFELDADRKTMSQYRDAARRHDLAIGTGLDGTTRLDWTTGTVIRTLPEGKQSSRLQLLEVAHDREVA